MIFENSKVYDILRYIIVIGIPSVSTFICALSQIYGFDGNTIVLTLSAVGVLLGSLLQISSNRYAKLTSDSEVG